MKFPMDRPVKVVMLGAGGTGGYVAPYLFRLLHMLDRPARFIICDGDLVEAKNLDRQNFVEADLGENKARVLSERYSTVLGMETEYVPNFIETLSDLMTLIEPGEWETDGYPRRKVREMVLLLGCVDNTIINFVVAKTTSIYTEVNSTVAFCPFKKFKCLLVACSTICTEFILYLTQKRKLFSVPKFREITEFGYGHSLPFFIIGI